jgi:hypothetical protein
MTRAIVVGGPAAGKVEYPLGRFHGDRWDILIPPKPLATGGIVDHVPATSVIERAEYTVRHFRFGDTRNEIFVLAPPEWSDFEVMAELLTVYQRAASADTHPKGGDTEE